MGKIIEKVRKQQERAREVRNQWAMHDAILRMPYVVTPLPSLVQDALRGVVHDYDLIRVPPPDLPPWWKFWA